MHTRYAVILWLLFLCHQSYVLCVVCLQANTEEKVLTRIACSSLMQKVIARWRQEHDDWEALAAFALSKNTGRRFKKKLPSDLNSTLDVAVSQNNLSEKTAVHFADNHETVSGPESSVDEGCKVTFVKPGADKPSKSKPELKASNSKLHAMEHLPMQQPSDGSCRSDTHRDVVVKQISLDELSDEELFLPPPDDDISPSPEAAVPNINTKIANSFFVVSSDGESSNDETLASTALVQTAVSSSSSSDTDGGNDESVRTAGLRSSIKSSTMFTKSLSHRQPSNAVKYAGKDRRKRKGSFQQNQQFRSNVKKHLDNRNSGKRFFGKQFIKSRDSHYPRKNEKSSYGDAKVNTK